jgi:Tfp pilus assembly protein PilN
MIEINLLPKEFRKGGGLITFDKRLLYIGIAAAVVLLAIGSITIYQKYQISTLDRQIAKARIEEERYREDLELIDALTEVKEKILERLDAVDRLDQRRDYYVRLMQDLNYQVPQFLWLTGVSEEIRQPVEKEPAQRGKNAAGKAQQEAESIPEIDETFSQAKLEGYAFNLSAIGSFMIGLMKSDYFDNIHLGRTIYERAADAEGYRFEITCDLNLEATETREEIEGLPEEDFSLSAHLEEF